MLRLQKNIRPHSRIKLSYLNTTNILTLTSGTQSVNWIYFLNTSIRILAHQNISFSGSYFHDVLCLPVVCYSTCNHRNSAIQCSRLNSLFICQTGRVCCMAKCVVKTIRKKKKREQFVWVKVLATWRHIKQFFSYLKVVICIGEWNWRPVEN